MCERAEVMLDRPTTRNKTRDAGERCFECGVKGHDVKECPRKMSSGRCRNDEHCTTMDEAMCVGHFVVGLRSQSSALVTSSDPTSWTVAVALARKCENTLLAARLLDSRQVSQKPSVENEKFQLEAEEPVGWKCGAGSQSQVQPQERADAPPD